MVHTLEADKSSSSSEGSPEKAPCSMVKLQPAGAEDERIEMDWKREDPGREDRIPVGSRRSWHWSRASRRGMELRRRRARRTLGSRPLSMELSKRTMSLHVMRTLLTGFNWKQIVNNE